MIPLTPLTLRYVICVPRHFAGMPACLLTGCVSCVVQEVFADVITAKFRVEKEQKASERQRARDAYARVFTACINITWKTTWAEAYQALIESPQFTLDPALVCTRSNAWR